MRLDLRGEAPCGVLLEVCAGATASPALWRVIDALTRAGPSERPASADEALRALGVVPSRTIPASRRTQTASPGAVL